MTACELRNVVSKSGFLFDWQKDRLLGMLDGDEEQGDDGRVLCLATVIPVLDNVFWRTTGIGFDSLPASDRMRITDAVREVTY